MDADVIIVGGGLAGLVACSELVSRGCRVLIVEQEPPQCLGGQAFWSLGGLFLVGTPLQKRLGIRDNYELALKDWMATAGFDRMEDHWPRKWAEAYIQFAAGEMYSWLRGLGIKFFPIVGWAERATHTYRGRGNSVPRFHIAWGTGPAILEPFVKQLDAAAKKGSAQFRFRHQVDELVLSGGVVTGVRGTVLEPSSVRRGERSSRTVTGDFSFTSQAVIVASGGIGGNLELVRENWPARLGSPPIHLLRGVPEHVDGRMLGIVRASGANVINPDRMWHYTEGVSNWAPVWKNHGIRILPGPSAMWLDGGGKRLPAPFYPGYDTTGTMSYLRRTGHDHSWFILNQKIIRKEFALSGSEQNPELTERDWKSMLRRAWSGEAAGPVDNFRQHGDDFIIRKDLRDLVAAANLLTQSPGLDYDLVKEQVMARDLAARDLLRADGQIGAIREARRYWGDKLTRVSALHEILDPGAGPLIAVRLHLLTRKTLGGLETNLDAQVIDSTGRPIPGLYAIGEVAGFGGGGMHGYGALEGSFLGGCLFSGRTAGKAVAATLV